MKIIWLGLFSLIIGVVLYTIQLNRWKGVEIYQIEKINNVQNELTDSCVYCLNLDSVVLYDTPLFTEDDFIEFNWGDQHIRLNNDGHKKLHDLEIPLSGLPMVMVLNDERVYEFWFWNMWSSFGCDRVYTYPKMDFRIEFGLPPGNEFGTDPRFDKRLEEYLD